mmetsp:Transcript_5190/g.9287  ORF Transcript_5190/g.9287 Transcript_5190/m.9287 type:complete len:341 (+) Transcript_5190:369-1391(+)
MEPIQAKILQFFVLERCGHDLLPPDVPPFEWRLLEYLSSLTDVSRVALQKRVRFRIKVLWIVLLPAGQQVILDVNLKALGNLDRRRHPPPLRIDLAPDHLKLVTELQLSLGQKILLGLHSLDHVRPEIWSERSARLSKRIDLEVNIQLFQGIQAGNDLLLHNSVVTTWSVVVGEDKQTLVNPLRLEVLEHKRTRPERILQRQSVARVRLPLSFPLLLTCRLQSLLMKRLDLTNEARVQRVRLLKDVHMLEVVVVLRFHWTVEDDRDPVVGLRDDLALQKPLERREGVFHARLTRRQNLSSHFRSEVHEKEHHLGVLALLFSRGRVPLVHAVAVHLRSVVE